MKSNSLQRFVDAQALDYAQALREVRAGRKTSHWIWYIFPQLEGLGHSDTALYYGIRDLDEARAYLAQPVLRAHLEEITGALLALEDRTARQIFGDIDSRKVCSCMTLFHAAEPANPLFGQVLDKYYGGRQDEKTLEKLRTGPDDFVMIRKK